MKTRKVLIVEDEHALALALATVVVRAGAEAVKVASGTAALERLRNEEFTLVVLDIGLPDMSGLEVLENAFPGGGELPVPVLVITAHGNLENAIAARKLGVAEYLVKPLDLKAFQDGIARFLKPLPTPIIEKAESVAETETTVIGAAAAMQPVFREVAHACSVSMPAIITGATGTGKSLVARVIHSNGEQRKWRLFSLTDKIPKAGGTLLVEDVDALAEADQQALLQVLEAEAGVRVIATTRRSLHDVVTAGRFREDLYYRLNVLEIRLPNLADRADDVPALAQYFLGRASNVRAMAFSAEAMALLEQHDWPGNVRELRNAVEYAVGVCGAAQILPQHLPASIVVERIADAGEFVASLRLWLDGIFEAGQGELRYADLIGSLEGELLRELLRRFDNKPTRLAAALGMNRTTLRKKCAELLGS
jgi:DNA-binding NtrC family response regulator